MSKPRIQEERKSAVLHCTAAGYGKNVVSKSIQFLPAAGSARGSATPESEGVARPAQEAAGPAMEGQVRLDKSNIILLGPTGCGESGSGWGRRV